MSHRKAFRRGRLFLTRLVQTTALSVALMTATTAEVHAENVNIQGAEGANGADGVGAPGGNGAVGGDASATANSGDSSNTANARGGVGGSGGTGDIGFVGGNGGTGGAATATATTTITSGAAIADASSVGGFGGGGGGGLNGIGFGAIGGHGGAGGSATAVATGSSGRGNVTASAFAMGGTGGLEYSQLTGIPGAGGDANATANASSGGGGTAIASAGAMGGLGGDGARGFPGAANANSTATTGLAGVSVQSNAAASAPTSASSFDQNLAGTLAVAQAGGVGEPVPGQGDFQDGTVFAYAISTLFPDKAYSTALMDGASNVAETLLGPSDKIFGTAVLGTVETDVFSGGGSASVTFDFTYQGDLLLGSVYDDSVINLGSHAGALTLDEPGIYVIGGVVPESSTWAMMLLGFAGLGFAGYRTRRRTAAAIA